MAVDNRSTNAQPTNVGFKISKPGYDANKTAGNNLIFSSSWPSLPIVFETTITNPITSMSGTATILHNLKYPPLAFIWAYGPDLSGIGNVERRIMSMLAVDSNTIYLTDANYATDSDFLYTSTKLHIKCFRVDLSKDIDYILAPGDTYKMPYDPNFGIKVVKPQKDINSKDMRDFAVHSRCQSPLVLAVKTESTCNPANPTIVQYTSKYQFPVWSYGFVKSTTGHYKMSLFWWRGVSHDLL